MKFKTVMFDFDGTVTDKGSATPTWEMTQAILGLARKGVPLAFCTGRQLESFEKHGLSQFVEYLADSEKAKVLENIFLISENGSIGYRFDAATDQYVDFYHVNWPESFLPKLEFKEKLQEAVNGVGEVLPAQGYHKEAVVIRTVLSKDLNNVSRVEEIYEMSTQIYERSCVLLESIDPNYEQYLHIGNSGIGVIICSAEGDKDNGIKRFADYLQEHHGLDFGPEAREVLVIGDRPQPSGNDHYFLKGRYGTPYTVGCYNDENPLPKPVFDNEGKRLLHAHGTRFLLEKFFGI